MIAVCDGVDGRKLVDDICFNTSSGIGIGGGNVGKPLFVLGVAIVDAIDDCFSFD